MTSDMQNSSPSDAGDGAGNTAGNTTRSSGLPTRGLAMILIAVAVLLAAWALWSMMGDSDDSAAGDPAAQTQEITDPATPQAQNRDEQNAQVTGADPAARDDQATPVTRDDQETGDRPGREVNAEASGDRNAGTGAPVPAPERDAGTPVTTLHVLNNSTVTQLAARVADSLEDDYDRVESGNLAEVVIPKTTVYFTPGNPDAEKSARELADRVNGVAMERSDVLPKETEGEDALVLVLVEDVAL